MTPSDWFDRYRAGECEDVWAELVQLGPEVRAADVWESARAVAHETMIRARRNIEALLPRLRATGYEFQYPDKVHVPPNDPHGWRLEEIEEQLGPIPLSLRMFYDVVGTVDLTQSWDQLVQWHEPDRDKASELQVLGEYDPLVVGPLDEDSEEANGYFFLAPDEFHKANYSGGENYHVRLPDPRADFDLIGVADAHGTDVGEYFVHHVRMAFRGGGFRGCTESDELRAWKVLPNLELTRMLADGLEEL